MMLDRTPLKDRAQGRWRGILPALGIDARYLDGKHHDCPICAEGKDRFRFLDTDGRGTWICNKCGSGEGIELVKLKLACDFKSAAPRIEALIGSADPIAPKPERSEADKRNAMTALWRSGKPITLADPAGRYLNTRCGLTEFPACLRYVEAMRHRETGQRYPGLIAKVTAPDGSPASVHRTYLTLDGHKAPLEDPRRLMPGTVAKGSAIRLAEPRNGVLAISEGLETAFAAMRKFEVPCWSAISARMLATWTCPPDVKELVICGDHDAKFAGQAAAFVLASKQRVSGKLVRVEIPGLTIDPALIGKDWDDLSPTGPDHEGRRG